MSRCKPSKTKNSTRIQDYVAKKYALMNTTYVIRPDGSSGFIVGGQFYPETEYLREHRPILLAIADNNYDRKNNWITGKQSY